MQTYSDSNYLECSKAAMAGTNPGGMTRRVNERVHLLDFSLFAVMTSKRYGILM
jgi:hypothetical protein